MIVRSAECEGFKVSPIFQFGIIDDLGSPLITGSGCEHVQFGKFKEKVRTLLTL